MRQIVIGLGEVGGALREVLGSDGFDTLKQIDADGVYDVVHICFPYSPEFCNEVRRYQSRFNAELTIIHSTVPIGTTKQIRSAVHSPVLGRHATMAGDLKNFPKLFGGAKASFAAALWPGQSRVHASSDVTEALKLLCLARYGVDIAMSHLARSVLGKLGAGKHEWLEWTDTYNANVDGWLKRPKIWPYDDFIGGHCVIPGAKLLADFTAHELLDAVLRYEKDDHQRPLHEHLGTAAHS